MLRLLPMVSSFSIILKIPSFSLILFSPKIRVCAINFYNFRSLFCTCDIFVFYSYIYFPQYSTASPLLFHSSRHFSFRRTISTSETFLHLRQIFHHSRFFLLPCFLFSYPAFSLMSYFFPLFVVLSSRNFLSFQAAMLTI